MEQRIGSIIPPTAAAGLDPAHIPGLVPPRPAEGDETDAAVPEQATDAEQAEEAPPKDAAPERVTSEGKGPDAEGSAPEDPGKEGSAGDDGPVFEASDRRGAIVADAEGITFRLDEEEARFGWDEIGAVEIGTPRFGRRFGVTVYVSSQRWFENDVEASSKAELKQWAAELDAVLDARFEDSDA
ncbi:hypothetical protein ABZY19_26545 [Streptomyces sp. NPDC006475]|uniref:hypothetical protein n=1 Tax=Streptomyces sp. NPDC006475 TaxID=3155719 RepID=UPI0033A46723